MEMLSKNQRKLVIGGIAIACIIIIIYYINSTKNVYNYDEFLSKEEEIVEESDENEDVIIVHVTGAVKNEGIVSVKLNARINDVIEAAGGLKDDAELNNVNLAYIVEDGQKIYIPSKSDSKEREISDEISTNMGMSEKDTDINSELININTASEEKLTKLPGIR